MHIQMRCAQIHHRPMLRKESSVIVHPVVNCVRIVPCIYVGDLGWSGAQFQGGPGAAPGIGYFCLFRDEFVNGQMKY